MKKKECTCRGKTAQANEPLGHSLDCPLYKKCEGCNSAILFILDTNRAGIPIKNLGLICPICYRVWQTKEV